MRALAAAMVLGAGCVGGSMSLTGDRLRHPVSVTEGVFDENHDLLGPEQLEELHEFRLERKNWTIFYSQIDLTSDRWDLSDELNALVETHQGEAIVGLNVVAENCGVNYVAILNLLPIWPGCADVVVTGVVVRRRPGVAPRNVAAASPSPAPVPPSMIDAPPAAAPAATTTAVAKPVPRDPRIGLYPSVAVGFDNCTGDCGDESDLALGLNLGLQYRFQRYLSIGGELHYLPLAPPVGDASIWSLLASARLYPAAMAKLLSRRQAATPGGSIAQRLDSWVGLGAGYASFSVDGGPVGGGMSGFAIAPALGVDYRFNDRTSLGGAFHYLVPFWERDTNAWQLMVQGRYRL